MARRTRTEKDIGKDAEPAVTDFDAGSIPPMERFKSLARRLIRVPKEELRDAEKAKKRSR